MNIVSLPFAKVIYRGISETGAFRFFSDSDSNDSPLFLNKIYFLKKTLDMLLCGTVFIT